MQHLLEVRNGPAHQLPRYSLQLAACSRKPARWHP
jgi:hypothetical protein